VGAFAVELFVTTDTVSAGYDKSTSRLAESARVEPAGQRAAHYPYMCTMRYFDTPAFDYPPVLATA
jgi:hypothetical protein